MRCWESEVDFVGVNKTMRRIVKVHTYTTVVTDTKEEIFRVPTFVRSVELLRWAENRRAQRRHRLV